MPKTTKKRKGSLNPPRELRAIQRFQEIMPREQLADILEQRTTDPGAERLYNLMFDPMFKQCKLPALCRKAGVSYKDLIEWLRDAKVGEGIVRMSQHVPQVLEDVAEDAKSKMAMCEVCAGSGNVVKRGSDPVEMESCKRCKGVGEVRVSGDSNARKLLFDAVGLGAKSSPLIDARHITVQGDEPLEEMLKRATQVVVPQQRQLPDPDVQEGEIVDDES